MSEGNKFDFGTWLKGKSRSEYYEHVSFMMIAVSVIMVWMGLLFGTAVKYVVFVSAFGALLLLPAIMLYIASQLMEVRHETATAQKQ
jgi:hypothetical protein